jgi:hypothetical protein
MWRPQAALSSRSVRLPVPEDNRTPQGDRKPASDTATTRLHQRPGKRRDPRISASHNFRGAPKHAKPLRPTPARAMLPANPKHSSGSSSRNDELVAKLMALRPGGHLTVIGLGQVRLIQILSLTPSAPRMLQLDFARVSTTALAIDRILDDLADLATALWPYWNATDSPERLTRPLTTWRRAAIHSASGGRRPRFPRFARETEIGYLLSVLSGIVLLAEVDSQRSERAAPIIAALEWCQRHGAAVVALFAEEPRLATPWDRLLHGAIIFEHSPVEPAVQRLIPPSISLMARGSAIERRIREALSTTPDLAGLSATSSFGWGIAAVSGGRHQLHVQ